MLKFGNYGWSSMKNGEIDAFDRALLAELQLNNQTPARLLAGRVGLSESAVLRRLRRLRNSGVIRADVSVVDPAVLGTPLTVHVLVSLEWEGTAALDAFERKLRARPEVQNAWYVTGDVEFVVMLRLASLGDYERFTREVFQDDPNVKLFRTLVALHEVRLPGARAAD